MPAAGTGADGLRLELSSAEVPFMRVVGAIAGVVVLATAAQNGVGSGRLICNDGLLQWQAPGSNTPGTAVDCSAGGTFLLLDGESISKWIRIEVYEDYLPAAGQATVLLQDAFNDFGLGDVDAADALAGQVETVEFELHNVSPDEALSVNLWLDPLASGFDALEVSQNGVDFYAPDSQDHADVLAWASIAAGASESVWVRRTIPAAEASAPELLNHLIYAWTPIPA